MSDKKKKNHAFLFVVILEVAVSGVWAYLCSHSYYQHKVSGDPFIFFPEWVVLSNTAFGITGIIIGLLTFSGRITNQNNGTCFGIVVLFIIVTLLISFF